MFVAPWHVSWTVSDIERSERFYCDLLGFQVVHRQEQANAYTEKLVGVPGAHLKVTQLVIPHGPLPPSRQLIELVEYVTPKGVVLDHTPNNVGAAHFAFMTTDALGDYARLAAAGVRFISPPNAITAGINQGGYTCYFKDPDGFTLEMMQPPAQRLAQVLADLGI